jgi:glycosyltransferase involved in cell wall biosynthesis
MSPLVIQEAFAAGIPVIASDVYGNREQIIHGVNGLLFAFRSESDLKKQLQFIIDDPSLIGKMKSQVQAPAGFEEAGMKYEELYKSL